MDAKYKFEVTTNDSKPLYHVVLSSSEVKLLLFEGGYKIHAFFTFTDESVANMWLFVQFLKEDKPIEKEKDFSICLTLCLYDPWEQLRFIADFVGMENVSITNENSEIVDKLWNIRYVNGGGYDWEKDKNKRQKYELENLEKTGIVKDIMTPEELEEYIEKEVAIGNKKTKKKEKVPDDLPF